MTASQRSITFDHAADYYDATRGFPPQIGHQGAEIIAEAARITLDSVLIEIGIATGRLALPLAQRSGPYYGVDLSTRMMKAWSTNEASIQEAISG